jgi:hypothetical protein
VTEEEAEAILGPEATARIRERASKAKPLTPQQITLLVGLLTVDLDAPSSDVA